MVTTWNAHAGGGVGMGIGLRMIAMQAANEVLRHCRIGKLTLKTAPEQRQNGR